MDTKPNGTTPTSTTATTPKPATANVAATTNPTKKNQTYNPNRIQYRPNRRQSRRRSCSCRRCCCLSYCWCLLIIFTILILTAIAATIFYFLYHPKLPTFSISALKISQFNLTTSSSDDTTRLTTKFNVTLSTTNQNKKILYTFDPITLTALTSTSGIDLSNGVFPGFISTPGNVTIVRSTLSMVSQVLDVDSVTSLRTDLKQNKNGLPVKILLDTKMVVQMENLKSKKVMIRVSCDGIHGTIPKGKVASVATFSNGGKCKVDLRIKIWKWTF